jgi:hypothetical protein
LQETRTGEISIHIKNSGGGEEVGGMEEAAGAVVEEEVAAGAEVVAVGGGFHGLDAATTRPKTSSKAPSSKAKAAQGLLW